MKTTLLLCLAALSAFAGSPVAGTWNGTLDNGSNTLKLSLAITEDAGKLAAVVTNLENNQKIPVESVKFEDGKVELNIPAQRGVYSGAVEGDDIKGNWKQGTNSLALNWKRAEGGAAITLTPAERDFAISYLEKTRQEFLEAIRGLNEAQWKYKPATGGWSVAECAEHITLSEDALFGLVMRQSKLPVDPKGVRTGREKDQTIIKMLTDRSKKAKAPEMLVPTGKFPTPDSVAAAFGEKRDRTVAFVKTNNDDLRGKISASPMFGTVDGYQYVLFLAGHSSRHTAQLLEVKADPGFPK